MSVSTVKSPTSAFGGIGRIGIGLLLLGLAIWFVDLELIIKASLEANGLWILIAVLLLPLNLALEAVKWQRLLAVASRQVTIQEALGSVLSGYALGFVTPARVGDYVGRVLYLAGRPNVGLVLLVALDRLYSLWIYALCGTLALWVLLQNTVPALNGAWWPAFSIGVAITLGLGVFAYKPLVAKSIANLLFGRKRWASRLHYFDALSRIRPSVSLQLTALASIRYLVFSTQFVCLILAFQPAASVPSLYYGAALVFFAKSILPSISFLDLGIRETASIFFLGLLGVAPAAAFNAALVLFGINLVIPSVLGMVLVPRVKWTRSEKQIVSTESATVQTG